MNVKVRTLTPIWTGDVDSKSNSIRSTGIIGSLRWWTEAILRGMGKFACDPTEDGRCPDSEPNKTKYCPACLIFGATGIRRLFRLEISGGTKVFDGRPINIKPKGRNKGWFLGSGVVGEIDFKIVPLDKDFDSNLVLFPLAIAAKWGGIGAKTQHGYGVVELENIDDLKFENFQNALNRIVSSERLNNLGIQEREGKKEKNDALPNIKEMFFAKVNFKVEKYDWWKEVDGINSDKNDPRIIKWVKTNSVPISPAIKNWLRFGDGKKLWQTGDSNNDREIENWLFGKINQDKSASKINISCAYKIGDNTWEFRIWGWIPKDGLPKGFDRNNFLETLKKELNDNDSAKNSWKDILGTQTENYNLVVVWREFNSSRDTVKENESDINKYLQSLIED